MQGSNTRYRAPSFFFFDGDGVSAPSIAGIPRDDRIAGVLLPVEQQRVGGCRNGVARERAVVDGDDPVRLDQRLAAEAVLLLVGVESQRQVAPVHEVVADRVPPVDAVLALWAELVEEVIAALPLAKAVRVAHDVLGRREVVERPERVRR